MLFPDYVRWVMEDANYLKIRLGFYYEIPLFLVGAMKKLVLGLGPSACILKLGQGIWDKASSKYHQIEAGNQSLILSR